VTTEKKASALVALIDKLIAEEPYEAHGVAWARRPLKFYSEALGVSLVTIRKRIAEGSFVKLVKSVEGAGRSPCSAPAKRRPASRTITPSAS
jgi:hypothetical protein